MNSFMKPAREWMEIEGNIIRVADPLIIKEIQEFDNKKTKPMNKDIQIFAYKGIVGILANPTSKYIAEHPGNGNLGVVAEAEGLTITQEAYDEVLKIKKSRDDIGDFDVFQAGDKVIIGWIGRYVRGLDPEKSEGSSSYKPELLKPYIGELELPKEFIEQVDGINRIKKEVRKK
jgi:hypothetical protein